MNDSPRQDVVLFAAALELSASERSAYLERACGADAKLRLRIEGLLRAHDTAGDFLEKPPPDAIGGETETAAGEKPGDRIGRYKLLEKIGEGGCGVVFVAEQEEPVRRRVALKVIRPGMDTKSVMSRFGAERQALALMDHPNIAKVFDAGATELGRPYFVMEMVNGVKITDYCDQNSLTTEERLGLFIQVCRAVQHAHQKGIIHRDIKPSNILVTRTEEGAAKPVVIDFGIAKATTNQRLTDSTVFTALEMLIGTPAYMSPEQAELSGVDVDTRTDIYSLGVLLYELLTGTTPFDSKELLSKGLDEMRRTIREVEPIKPSTRLTQELVKARVGESERVAKAEAAESHSPTHPLGHFQPRPRYNVRELQRLIPALRGDLDWIVMKALEKDRSRRYETANGLAMDVQRHLANEAISARPPSKLYRFKKTVSRNKLLFSATGVIAVLLVVSLVVVSASLSRERTEAAKSRQVTQFLKDMLQGVNPSVALGQDTTVLHAILDRTAERIGNEMTNQPAVEAELRELVGKVYQEIGDYDQAEQMQRAALAINQKLHGPESPEAAASLNNLGVALVRRGKWREAEAFYKQALAIRRRRFADGNAVEADSLSNLAELYTQQGRIAEAEALSLQALAVRTRLFGSESLQAADSLRNLGIILGDEGRWSQAEETERKVLAIRRKLLKPTDPVLATTLTDVAWAAGGAGNLEEAESLEREALAIRRKVLRADHPDVAKSLYLVGDRLRQRGKLAEAEPFLNEALAMQRRMLAEDNPNLLDTMHSLAERLEADGKLAESEKMHREALALWRKQGESEYPQALSELGSLSRVLIAQKKFDDAQHVLDEALTPELITQPLSAELLRTRAEIEGRRGRWREASTDAIRAFDNQPFGSGQYSIIAALLLKAGNRSAYEQFCRRIFAMHANTTNIYVADQLAKACLFAPSSELDLKAIGRLADAAVTLGAGDEGAMPFFEICQALSDYRLGHFAEAADWAQKSVNSSRQDAHAHAYGILAMADWQLGKKDEARAMRAKGDALAPGIMPARIAEDPGSAWLAWLFARIQLEEAAALLGSGPAAGPGLSKE